MWVVIDIDIRKDSESKLPLSIISNSCCLVPIPCRNPERFTILIDLFKSVVLFHPHSVSREKFSEVNIFVISNFPTYRLFHMMCHRLIPIVTQGGDEIFAIFKTNITNFVTWYIQHFCFRCFCISDHLIQPLCS